MDVAYHHRRIDLDRVVSEYPPAPGYLDERWLWPVERMRELQAGRLRATLEHAATIPFYQRLWEASGFEPGDVRDVDDLALVPAYTIDDIRASIERAPPLGDYQTARLHDPGSAPLRLFMSGGTTGRSRPTLYTPWDREVGAILSARAFWLHGMRPGDVVMNAWSYSTHNAAWIMDHALYRWLGCTPLTTSTGVVTATDKQVRLAHEYGVESILATGDYLVHLAGAARELGLDPRTDFGVRTLSTFGNRELVRAAWGCDVFDSYAFHEVQYVAIECHANRGLHVMDDAFLVQVVDFETGEPLPPGERGNLVITELYKTGTRQVRYDIQDISARLDDGPCPCGSPRSRIDYFQGRSDTMVKLRGVNVWPEACGELLADDGRLTGEYFCYAERDQRGRDSMTVMVEVGAPGVDRGALGEELAAAFKRELGVTLEVALVDPGDLAELTGHGTRAKLRRFEDRRR